MVWRGRKIIKIFLYLETPKGLWGMIKKLEIENKETRDPNEIIMKKIFKRIISKVFAKVTTSS